MSTISNTNTSTTLNTTSTYYEDSRRLKALKRFATTTTLISLLGHGVLGFEQAYVAPIAGVLFACGTQLFLDWVRAAHNSRRPAFLNSFNDLLSALLPAYIVGLTCGMFLYPADRISPIAFAAILGIGTKFIFQTKIDGLTRHYLNPSNIGILATLVLFPAVSIVLPYGFSSQVGDWGKAGVPIVLFALGAFLNGKVTKKLPLVAGWLGAFILQAGIRSLAFDANILATLAPATGVVAVLFTFFMVTDPGTTPEQSLPQFIFGASVGLPYGVLISAHAVFALFWALCIVCATRGLYHIVKGGFSLHDTIGNQQNNVSNMPMRHEDEASERAAG
ncbi:MAG: enediyne biosynthesis protein UnbU [Proteobacteria bacterium]|nr:enediyne biosynthesis protein UnbU [Pseudomonadota bacterium]